MFDELVGIAAQVGLWNTVPHWYGLSLLILYPAGVLLGAKLGIGKGAEAHSAAA